MTRRWLGAAKLAHDAAIDGAVAEAEHKAKQWLATDQPDGAFDRHPLHWPLVFPEVFDPARPGFDAIIGNPPFLGGTKITGHLAWLTGRTSSSTSPAAFGQEAAAT